MINKDKYLLRLVDDDEEFLDALSFILRTEGWIIASYSDAQKFLDEADLSSPGCILLDVRMPKLSGTEVQLRLNERDCTLPLIFLTGHGDLDTAVHVFREGACDFLQKPVSTALLTEAIVRSLKKDDENRANVETSLAAKWERLTDREHQIVADVAAFLPNKAIAEHFGISERTVEVHRAAALKKLELRKPEEVALFMEQLRKIGRI